MNPDIWTASRVLGSTRSYIAMTSERKPKESSFFPTLFTDPSIPGSELSCTHFFGAPSEDCKPPCVTASTKSDMMGKPGPRQGSVQQAFAGLPGFGLDSFMPFHGAFCCFSVAGPMEQSSKMCP